MTCHWFSRTRATSVPLVNSWRLFFLCFFSLEGSLFGRNVKILLVFCRKFLFNAFCFFIKKAFLNFFNEYLNPSNQKIARLNEQKRKILSNERVTIVEPLLAINVSLIAKKKKRNSLTVCYPISESRPPLNFQPHSPTRNEPPTELSYSPLPPTAPLRRRVLVADSPSTPRQSPAIANPGSA